MVRRNAWNQAKGFFEGYGKGYFEDADLAFTLRKLGYRIYIDTNAVATHYVGTTMKEQKDLPPLDNNRMIFAMRHQGEFYWTESEIL